MFGTPAVATHTNVHIMFSIQLSTCAVPVCGLGMSIFPLRVLTHCKLSTNPGSSVTNITSLQGRIDQPAFRLLRSTGCVRALTITYILGNVYVPGTPVTASRRRPFPLKLYSIPRICGMHTSLGSGSSGFDDFRRQAPFEPLTSRSLLVVSICIHYSLSSSH